jgi:hypothetical protein
LRVTVVATGFSAVPRPRLAAVGVDELSSSSASEDEEAAPAPPTTDDELEIPGFLRSLDDE